MTRLLTKFQLISAAIICVSACSTIVSEGDAVNAVIEESEWSGVTGLAGLNDHRLFVSVDGRAHLLDLVDPPMDLGAADRIRDAADWPDGRVFLLTESSLQVWDGVLRPSPLNDVLPGSGLRNIEAMGKALWLAGPDSSSLWQDGRVHHLSFDGESGAAPLQRAPIAGRDAVWAALGNGVVAVMSGIAGYTPVERHDVSEPPTHLAADASGSLWAAAGGLLHRRAAEGVWTELRLSSDLRWVAGNERATRIWLGTEEGVFTGVDGELSPVSGLPESIADPFVDDVGRLHLRSGERLLQASIGRPIALRNLPDGDLLLGMVHVLAVPTLRAEVQSLSALLGGMDQVVEPREDGTFTVVLDPVELDTGEHELVLTADYGSTRETLRRTLLVSNPTWSADIEPIFANHCVDCHGGQTGTARLDTPESWEQFFDDIVDRVERNNMPLGTEPLTDLQKGSIRAWGAKGFPR